MRQRFENENKFEEYLGEFIVDMTGLLGFSRLKAGDKYEVALRYGKGQKWKSNGQIVKKGYQLGKISFSCDSEFSLADKIYKLFSKNKYGLRPQQHSNR